MSIPISPDTATDLKLRGSTGSFAIAGPGGASIPVNFLLTYAGFTESGHYSKLLNFVTPVRELFELASLDFDELLQRDLDDARISEDLIPYLLDARTSSLVRLFPPIVAIMLPYQESKKPGPLYPPVTTSIVHFPNQDHDMEVIQSGPTGSESFVLERPVMQKTTYFHDQNKLSINTSKMCLAIVDGQHRAMALLALHRNITNGWNDMRRAPYRDFYSHWTSSVLGDFDLSLVSLPMMICFLPALDQGTSYDFDLIKASRSVFLALNKNARRVSISRNRLLDDNDICAEYLRAILTLVKRSSEPGTLRLWNVELDQSQDRTRLESKSAITGVNHLYYLIEHLVVRTADQVEISNRPGRYASRIRLEDHFRRIGALDVLGQAVCESTSRDNYSIETAKKLELLFMSAYGIPVVRMLSEIEPLSSLIDKYAALESSLKNTGQPELYESLFGVGGTSQAITEHVGNLRRHRREGDQLGQSDAAKDAIEKFEKVSQLESTRGAQAKDAAGRSGLSELDAVLSEELVNAFVEWNASWTSVAFQAALVATFFEMVERVNHRLSIDGKPPLSTGAELDQYIGSINSFLRPTSFEDLRNLVIVFRGAAAGSTLQTVLGPAGPAGYRPILGISELQPDSWPKIRYILLELWDSSTPEIKSEVEKTRTLLRGKVFSGLYRRGLGEKARQQAIAPEDLEASIKDDVFNETLQNVQELVRALSNGHISSDEMHSAIAEQIEIDVQTDS